jgi:Leucine-rich repeat (LRR) protein
MHVTGDQFIRTLAAYMRSHESTWSHHPTTKTTTTAAPSSTTGLFVSWLGYNNNSDGNNNHNNSSSSNSNHNNHKPFIVDPWHLFYLNTRFEELDLSLLECEDDIIESIVEARGQMTRPTTMNHQSNTTNTTSAAVASLQRAVRPPSMVSVASQRSVTSTAMTLFTGFTRWSTTGSNSQKANEAPHTTVEEDVRFIHQCMQRIAAVRIGPFGKRRILDADDGTDRPNGIQVSLGAFSNVRQLEVIKISPLALTGWMRLQSQLERVGCRGRLVRVEDLLLKTLQLEMQQRILTERLTTSSDDKRDESTLKSDDDDQQQQQQQQLLHSTELLEELEALCQLSPLEVWPRLVALDLTGNSLTDIPDHPFIYVRHCMELNLSRNILTSIPRSLKDLAQLRSLDVSYNKIDSLTGIGELLPTLVQLSLASNRLRSIIGLEQLSRLERLDLSHNQIEDPQEMNRLSGLLHLSHLQVEGNPLVNIVSVIID